MKCFVINLDRAADRWARVRSDFAPFGFDLIRVVAIDGQTLALPCPEFDETRYRRCHGKKPIPNEIACYLSHRKAWRLFLETSDPYAIIAEDDVSPVPGCRELLDDLIAEHASWNLVKLMDFRSWRYPYLCYRRLRGGHSLGLPFFRTRSSGAYLLDRTAAENMFRFMVPMVAPIDHMMEQDWRFGFHLAAVKPAGFQLTEMEHCSTIGNIRQARLHASQRLPTVVPYRARVVLERTLYRLYRWIRLLCAKRRDATPDPTRAKNEVQDELDSPVPSSSKFRSTKPSSTKPSSTESQRSDGAPILGKESL